MAVKSNSVVGGDLNQESLPKHSNIALKAAPVSGAAHDRETQLVARRSSSMDTAGELTTAQKSAKSCGESVPGVITAGSPGCWVPAEAVRRPAE